MPNDFINKNKDRLKSKDYESIMSYAEDGFTRQLEKKSVHTPPNTLRFLGLQRWNSLTPAQGKSVGGGYFLYQSDETGKVKLGIAIDPGFDFLRNFLRNGFSIRDIDFVLISHAHPDHLWDFESVVQLLKELDDKKHIKHRINVILTLGIYNRFEHLIRNQALREFIEPFVIDIRKEIDLNFFRNLGSSQEQSEIRKHCFQFVSRVKSDDGNPQRWKPYLPLISSRRTLSSKDNVVEIWPTCAYHDDYSGISDSFGFMIKVKESDISFGYTGDTKWVGDELYSDDSRWKNIAQQYRDCDVLLIHLGSLIDHKNKEKKLFENYKSFEDCNELIREKNHPYLMGMIRLLSELTKNNDGEQATNKLILIGEFGEELRGGIRLDIIDRLQAGLTPRWPMLPVDVGLDIVLNGNKSSIIDNKKGYEFICALCDRPCQLGSHNEKNGKFESKIQFHRYGHDEAIFYICDTCYKSVPDDVRQNKLKQLYEIGRELKTQPDFSPPKK